MIFLCFCKTFQHSKKSIKPFGRTQFIYYRHLSSTKKVQGLPKNPLKQINILKRKFITNIYFDIFLKKTIFVCLKTHFENFVILNLIQIYFDRRFNDEKLILWSFSLMWKSMDFWTPLSSKFHCKFAWKFSATVDFTSDTDTRQKVTQKICENHVKEIFTVL